MKKSILTLCALTLAAGLAACGGGTSRYTVGGTVSGLQYPGLILTNNLSDDVTVGAPGVDANGNVKNVSYQFPKQLDYGDAYSVTVKQPPLHQECEPSNVPGNVTQEIAGRLSSINAAFVCRLTSHTIGVEVTGLKADRQVVLNNGSSKLTVVKPGSFDFPDRVTYGDTYGVTVLTQPTDQTCTVTGGAGRMEDADVKSIQVNCV